ncbi:uncharacterized protein LOC129408186 [Boleophthalmus pectinirostris]|uniref:uncharacterized protein LOC129408186 n=1 Tax=Boleophthalmus pectinirostris TaxID=150288 RepID=UPI00242AE632|nr:uncharacterized protein LOC129408186 [Boleophthalmus pectinirostris]
MAYLDDDVWMIGVAQERETRERVYETIGESTETQRGKVKEAIYSATRKCSGLTREPKTRVETGTGTGRVHLRENRVQAAKKVSAGTLARDTSAGPRGNSLPKIFLRKTSGAPCVFHRRRRAGLSGWRKRRTEPGMEQWSLIHPLRDRQSVISINSNNSPRAQWSPPLSALKNYGVPLWSHQSQTSNKSTPVHPSPLQRAARLNGALMRTRAVAVLCWWSLGGPLVLHSLYIVF